MIADVTLGDADVSFLSLLFWGGLCNSVSDHIHLQTPSSTIVWDDAIAYMFCINIVWLYCMYIFIIYTYISRLSVLLLNCWIPSNVSYRRLHRSWGQIHVLHVIMSFFCLIQDIQVTLVKNTMNPILIQSWKSQRQMKESKPIQASLHSTTRMNPKTLTVPST